MCLQERPVTKHLGRRSKKGGYDTESKQAYLHAIEQYAEPDCQRSALAHLETGRLELEDRHQPAVTQSPQRRAEPS